MGRYLLALLLTVAIEGAVAWFFGFRTARLQLAVAMINCLTNPALNLLLVLLSWSGVEVKLPLVTFLELPVILVEWGLMVYVIGGPNRRLFTLSFVANTTSFLAGVLLFWI